MNWIETFTGVAFDLEDPRPENINVRDIAHALARICRFTGHVERFYCVAQHCVIMSYMVDPRHALSALMHDATEAYVGDVSAPLKKAIRSADGTSQLALVEYGIHCAVQAFVRGVSGADILDQRNPIIVQADLRMLMTERRDLFLYHKPPRNWGIFEKPYAIKIHPWSSELAEVKFLQRFAELIKGGAQ